MGRLSNTSPPFQPDTPDYRYYDALRLPNALLVVVRFSLSSHDTPLRPLICVSTIPVDSPISRTAHQCLEYLVKVAPLPLFNRETFGPPEFPGYPLDQMTRSKTPVVTSMLAMTHRKPAAFQKIQPVGFPPTAHELSGLSNDHHYTFFRAQY